MSVALNLSYLPEINWYLDLEKPSGDLKERLLFVYNSWLFVWCKIQTSHNYFWFKIQISPHYISKSGRDADPSPLSSALVQWTVRPVQSLSACTRVHFYLCLIVSRLYVLKNRTDLKSSRIIVLKCSIKTNFSTLSARLCSAV